MKINILEMSIVAIMMGSSASPSNAQSNNKQHIIKINGDDLSCSRYNGEEYFYAKLNGNHKIPETVFDHGFSKFLFSDSCAQVDDLKGMTHDAVVNVNAQPYEATICERGSIWYCQQYGCYMYRVEYVDLNFSNGLKLSSEVHTASDDATKIHDGRCTGGK